MEEAELTLKVEPSQELRELFDGAASTSYELESAIASTVEIIKGCDSQWTGFLADRLGHHLDQLLAEQLRQVSAQPLAPLAAVIE